MTRIARCFQRCRETGRKALIPYITGGDPEPAATAPLMHALVAGGADVVEIGMPFSDPMADGPVIQAACERALAAGTTVPALLEAVATFRQDDADTPVVLMGYVNPLEQLGYQRFAEEAARAGVDGLICVDVPPEESLDLRAALDEHGIEPIWLVAPTTPAERLQTICEAGGAFVYYVSLKGVTGAATLDVDDVAKHVGAIRGYTQLPVGVGFGINDGVSAGRIAAVADAVVVGSSLVRRIGEHQGDPSARLEAARSFIGSLRAGIDAAQSEPVMEAP